jgi:hypothetical protein
VVSSVPVNRPEDELLLCCARTTRSPEAAARIRALIQEDMDWEYLLRTAHRHGMAPLLCWHIDATCPKAVPLNALDRLRSHFRTNSLRNLFLTGELLRILNVFGTQGISAIPYKGPALATSIYGNLALREFSDLDILVHQYDVPKAKEVLASIGYQADYRLSPQQEAAFLRSECEHPFTRGDGRVVVELHWGIVEKHFFSFDAERLWERLHLIPLGGDTVLNLSLEDMLLILCVHGARHAWERLGWICDVAEVVRACQDISWERVMTRASKLGGERMLLLGLFLASDLLGATIPERVSERVRTDPTVKTLAKRTREQLFRETDCPPGFLEGYKGAPAFHVLHLGVRERWRDKIRYCVLKTLTLRGEDWELLPPLPKFLFPFYYVLRLIRLTGKYGPKMLKRFLRLEELRKRLPRVPTR